MNRAYVILHHTGYGEAHYDLLLATDDTGPLLAWRSPVWPLREGTPLTHLPDHRRAYLRYEGPISGDRGEVRRVAQGSWQRLNKGPAAEVLEVRFDEDPVGWRLGEVAGAVEIK